MPKVKAVSKDVWKRPRPLHLPWVQSFPRGDSEVNASSAFVNPEVFPPLLLVGIPHDCKSWFFAQRIADNDDLIFRAFLSRSVLGHDDFVRAQFEEPGLTLARLDLDLTLNAVVVEAKVVS